MNIRIAYGHEVLHATLPDGSASFTIKEPENCISEAYFSAQIESYLNNNTLDLSNPVVVIADKTRLCGYAAYLPVLVKVLKEFGLNRGKLRFIIAYGTHSPQSDIECIENYGEIYNQCTFLHHDCTELENFIDGGSTSRGTPIRLRKDIYHASCVITMGPICHHYFAGYGGGRKLIFPGCGERRAIYANHSLYLDNQKMQLSQSCQPGILEDNPLAEDLFEIADKKEADLAIHGIMNSHGQLCDIVVGQGRESYLEACSRHAALCETDAPGSPCVIASCGGFPKDINFIQSHKAIHNAAMFVEDGGTLLIYSQCRDGIGSKTFLPWFEKGGFSHAFRELQENYQGNGGTALALMTKTGRIRIKMVTNLEESTCQLIGVEKLKHTDVIKFLQKSNQPVTFITNASLLVRKSTT